MRIAIDAMGGDHAPVEIVAGTLEAAAQYPEAQFLLIGDQAVVEQALDGRQPGNVEVRHAPDIIGMGDHAARSVRKYPDSSLCLGVRLLAEGAVDGVFSAGNTGAATAASMLWLGRLPGVHRPAIALAMPARGPHGKIVLCDVGACVDSRPEWLVQFGIMGALYAEEVEHIATPRVGLLNIGEESCKGNTLTKTAHELFGGAGVNWVGNVEGKDVFRGTADVIACDGFDGNLVLKLAEGAADYFVHLLRDVFGSGPAAKLGALLARPALHGMKRKIDYAEYGGAFLLGVKGLVMIGHGRSQRLAVRNALTRLHDGVENGLLDRIQARFAAEEAAA